MGKNKLCCHRPRLLLKDMITIRRSSAERDGQRRKNRGKGELVTDVVFELPK